MNAGARLVPYLDVDEAVCTDDEIAESVETNTGQSHEHTRVVQVLEVVRGRVVFDECVTIREGHHHDQRVRFVGFVGRDADEHLPMHLQGGLAPCGCHFHVRKGRPIASTTANVCSRLSPSASRADETGLLGMSFSGVYGDLEPKLRRAAARPVHGDYSTKVAYSISIFAKSIRNRYGVTR